MTKPDVRTAHPEAPGPVALRAWMAAEGLSQLRLAAALRCTQPAVAYWVRGSRFPGAKLRARLEALSKGAVPAKLWKRPHRRYLVLNTRGRQPPGRPARPELSVLYEEALARGLFPPAPDPT